MKTPERKRTVSIKAQMRIAMDALETALTLNDEQPTDFQLVTEDELALKDSLDECARMYEKLGQYLAATKDME